MPFSNNPVPVSCLLWESHLLGKPFPYLSSSPKNHWFVRAWELAALKGRVLNGLDLFLSLLIHFKIVTCYRQTWRISGLFLPLFDRLTFSSTLHLHPTVWGPIAPAEGIAGNVLYSPPWHQRLLSFMFIDQRFIIDREREWQDYLPTRSRRKPMVSYHEHSKVE